MKHPATIFAKIIFCVLPFSIFVSCSEEKATGPAGNIDVADREHSVDVPKTPSPRFGQSQTLELPTGFKSVDRVTIGDSFLAVSDSRRVAVYEQISSGRTWKLLQTIDKPENDTAGFGGFISFGDKFLAIAAKSTPIKIPIDGKEEFMRGKVFIYDFDDVKRKFELKQELLPESRVDYFGESVLANGEILAVSATARPNTIVFTYRRNGEGQWNKTPSVETPRLFDFNKSSMFVGESFMAIGDSEANNPALTFYSRTENDWKKTQSFPTKKKQKEYGLGNALAFDGKNLFAGKNYTQKPFQACGAVYQFAKVRKKWKLVSKLNAPKPVRGEFFGKDLACGSGYLFVKASSTSGCERDPSIYVYSINDDTLELVENIPVGKPIKFQQTMDASDSTLVFHNETKVQTVEILR